MCYSWVRPRAFVNKSAYDSIAEFEDQVKDQPPDDKGMVRASQDWISKYFSLSG